MQQKHSDCLLSVVCLLVLSNCANRKLAPVASPLSSLPAPVVTIRSPAATAGREAAQPERKATQPKPVDPEIGQLLPGPPRMNFSPARANAPRKEVQRIDKITMLVNSDDGTLLPNSEFTIQNALKPLADQMLFVCPDRMRVGAPVDCRFATKGGLDDFFRSKLLELGVPAPEAAMFLTVVSADLLSPDRGAFDIRAVKTDRASSNEQLWRVTPRSSGDHRLELNVKLGARTASAGEVQGAPVLLVHTVSVIDGNFLTEYWPAMIGCLAALALFTWIVWTLWHNARPSAVSNR